MGLADDREDSMADALYAVFQTAPEDLFASPRNAAVYVAKKLREMGW